VHLTMRSPLTFLHGTVVYALQEKVHQAPTCGSQSWTQRGHTTGTSYPTRLHSTPEHESARHQDKEAG